MRTVPWLALFSALLAVGILVFFLRADPTSEGEGPAAPQRPAWEGGDPARLAGRSVEETASADLPRSVLPAPPAPEECGVLLVRAVVGGTEVPVAGVEVVLVAAHPWGFATFRADGRGEVLFTSVPAGTARVHAAGAGWVSRDAETVAIHAGAETVVHLRLAKAVSLSGLVTATADGLPVAGAEVTAYAGGSLPGAILLVDRAPYGTSTTDARGRFVVPAVSAGAIVTLRCRAEGYRVTEVAARAIEGEEVRIALAMGGSVRGVVTGPTGPVAGARVVVAPTEDGNEPDPEAEGAVTATTDAKGHFLADGLPLDEALAAQADAEAWAASEVVAGIRLDLTRPRREIALRLRAPASVHVRVLGPDGTPVIATAAIGGAPFFSGLNAAEGETDREGRLLLDLLDPGSTLVVVESPGFLRWSERLTLAEGEARDLTVALEAGVLIEGVVVDDRGVPVAAATVFAPTRRALDPEATTDADGRFVLAGLTSGKTYELRVIADAHVGVSSDPVQAPAEGVRIVARREGRVRAHLVLPAGFPTPATQIVEVVKDDGSLCVEAPWKEGRVDRALAPGSHRVQLSADGLQPSEHSVTIRPGETVDLGAVHLERARYWHGVVVDEQGAPIERATVMVLPHIDEAVLTDAEGRFSLPDPGSLPQRLAVKAEGYRDGLVAIEEDVTGGLRVVLVARE